MDHVDTMESDRDGNADVLLMLMQQLPLQDRLQLSRVSKQWHTAAIAATKDLDATVNDAKSPSLTRWLHRNGTALETLAVHSSEPSDIPRQFFIAVKDPVGEVDFVLPSASLPNLHRLRLFNVQVYCGMNLTPGGLPSWGTSSDLVSLPASLTSLKAVDSHYINAYICDLTGLRQLSLSDMDFPMGELRRIATTLTQLTRLRLEWTGDAAWEYRCETSEYGFSRHGYFYEPNTHYCDDSGEEDPAACAFTEDITFLFEGLPALLDLEVGCYTDMRGDEALSRNIKCAPFAWAPEVPQAEGACAGAIAEQAGSAGGSGGGGGASAAGAGAARQRLTSLRVRNVLDIDGTVNMMTPGLTHLEMSLGQMRSIEPDESVMLLLRLTVLRHQLAHLELGTGMIAEDVSASSFRPIAHMSMLTCLKLRSDAGPPGAMSAMFSGGPDSLSRLKVLHCTLNEGFKQLYMGPPVKRLLDLKAIATACPNLEELDLSHQHGALFAQDVAANPATACRALRSLTALTSLALRSDDSWLDCMFDDFASLAQLQHFTILTISSTPNAGVTWPRLSKLSALTNLHRLDASPVVKVTEKLPWKYPGSWAGGGQVADAPAGPSEGGAVDSGQSSALHQVLADVASSEQLQWHAAKLIKAYTSPTWVRSEDPGW